MFERFTERARQVVVLAQQAAHEHHHNYIGTEHILEGLIREEEGLACRVLEGLSKRDDLLKDVQEHIQRIVGSAEEEATSGQIPFTPRGKKVLEIALREALSLGHNYIGTEHILLALAREGEGVGVRILKDMDLNTEDIRNEVIRMLSGPGGRQRKRDPAYRPKVTGLVVHFDESMSFEQARVISSVLMMIDGVAEISHTYESDQAAG
jgi:ATP-dependent Clp protease ATP-binding subunit ClpC